MNKDWILKHRNRICENTACNKKYSEHQNGGACGDFVTSGKRIYITDSHDVGHNFTNWESFVILEKKILYFYKDFHCLLLF